MNTTTQTVNLQKLPHGAHWPADLPKDAREFPPVPCEFSVGDRVLFTNDAGLRFEKTVRGFAPVVESWGAFVYIFTDAWWFPVRPDDLQLIAKASAAPARPWFSKKGGLR